MLSIFNLESYKNYLISSSTWEYDNNIERDLMKKEQYSVEYLQSI